MVKCKIVMAAAIAGVLCAPIAFAQEHAHQSVAGTAADNTQVNKRDRSGATVKPTDQPNNQTDIDLAAAVRSAIVKDDSLSMMAHNVKLVAANGVVTLRGPVKTNQEKATIGKIVGAVHGVSRVDNKLDVKHD